MPAAPDTRAKRCAIAALVAFADVPIVHFSVTWWRTLHQDGTVFNEELSAHIHGVMAFTLWFGVFAFTLLFVYLLDCRYRLLALEEQKRRARGRAGDRRADRDAGAAVDPARTADAARRSRSIRMKFAEYVITGWVLTGVVVFGYWLSIVQRTRRAERSLPVADQDRE